MTSDPDERPPGGKFWMWLAALLLLTTTAFGRSISQAPRPTVLLTTGEFLALDDVDSVTLYDQKGTTIRRFPGTVLSTFAATSDEKFLLLACYDGHLKLFDLRTGAAIWAAKTPRDSGIRFIFDASIAWDGRSFIACDDLGQAFIYDTTTGKQIGAVKFPPNQTNIMSVALSPDGSKGVLIDGSEHVFIFDTASGKPKATGLKGTWPIRYSANGRYFSFSSEKPGMTAHLRIAAADGKSSVDAGDFMSIGHIKPMPDGKFLVSAMADAPAKSEYYLVVGAVCDPSNGKVAVLWKMPFPLSGVGQFTDFDPEKMLGVSTDYRLVTSILDFKNSKTLLTIDNSANYEKWDALERARMRGSSDLIVTGLVTATGIAVVVLIVWVLRRRRAEAGAR